MFLSFVVCFCVFLCVSECWCVCFVCVLCAFMCFCVSLFVFVCVSLLWFAWLAFGVHFGYNYLTHLTSTAWVHPPRPECNAEPLSFCEPRSSRSSTATVSQMR